MRPETALALTCALALSSSLLAGCLFASEDSRTTGTATVTDNKQSGDPNPHPSGGLHLRTDSLRAAGEGCPGKPPQD